jgi:oligoribonuclease NrnB/cAMP/cGMP phosphodiesterase (DHH superfamily)
MFITEDGTVFKENSSIYTDDNVGYKMKLTTAWLKFASIQGYQRIRKAMILGDYYSDHKMKMSVRYNYEDAYVEEHLWEADEVLNQTSYGSSATYGSETPYGGAYENRYQFQAGLGRQKVQAIGFSFEDVSETGLGRGYSISNLLLEVGIKEGGFRLSDSRQV